MRRERRHELVNGGMSFFFTVSVSPLSLTSLFFSFFFLHFRFSLVPFVPFARFSIFLLYIFFFRHTWADGLLTGPAGWDRGGQVLYFFVF